MNLYDDLMTVEGGGYDDEDMDELEQAKAMQRVVNDGSGWRMQGSMGRAMMAALEAGDVLLGKHATADYYGNRIPSRDEVKDGTKGSYGYVMDRHGPVWANEMKDA